MFSSRVTRTWFTGLVVAGAFLTASTALGAGGRFEAWSTNPASGCAARVQQPVLNANQQVVAYTEVFCPRPTQLTVRSRVRSDYAFQDITVAEMGVVNVPQGYTFYKLTCPKSANRRTNQRYYTQAIIYPGTNKSAASPFPQRSAPSTLSPYCAY
jgi:hypothetical protein